MAISECSIIVSSGIICKNGQLKGENILLASRYDDTIEIAGFFIIFSFPCELFHIILQRFGRMQLQPSSNKLVEN
jgi:hypothetical protein